MWRTHRPRSEGNETQHGQRLARYPLSLQHLRKELEKTEIASMRQLPESSGKVFKYKYWKKSLDQERVLLEILYLLASTN